MFQAITAAIQAQCPKPLAEARASECEVTLNIGIFFDGTDNNRRFHKNPDTNTNIARLWQAYRYNSDQGSYSHYVSGVATPFRELDYPDDTLDSRGKPIPKREAESRGGPMGVGGEIRILYGLLQVINSVHAYVNDKKEKF